jgi:deoxycytidylate deaminase
MNIRVFNRCVEMARALKPAIKSGKSHHISAAIYKNKIICVGVNDYRKFHPYYKFGRYEDHKGFATEYRPSLHSEISLICKLGEENLSDFEILNVRIGADDKIRMSCPCFNCARVLQSLGPKRVYFSNDEGGFSLDERF